LKKKIQKFDQKQIDRKGHLGEKTLVKTDKYSKCRKVSEARNPWQKVNLSAILISVFYSWIDACTKPGLRERGTLRICDLIDPPFFGTVVPLTKLTA